MNMDKEHLDKFIQQEILVLHGDALILGFTIKWFLSSHIITGPQNRILNNLIMLIGFFQICNPFNHIIVN